MLCEEAANILNYFCPVWQLIPYDFLNIFD